MDDDADFLRQGVQLLSQMLMELEVDQQVGASKYERTPERSNYRNGYRGRTWETRVGDVKLAIPKLRKGSYFPSLLERRRPAEKALLAVVQEAYLKGVSTRKVDALVKALGLSGIDKSKVSRICKDLDQAVEQFRNRPLQESYPYLWLDALYLKVRQNHRIVSLAMVIAIGVDEDGERHLLGFDLGGSEDEAFWLAFLRSLIQRGVKSVQLVISDAHEGLKNALNQVFSGASWQRCRVHFMRNLLAKIPHRDKAAVAEAVRLTFEQPSRQSAEFQLQQLAEKLGMVYPDAATLLAKAEQDILAYKLFPKEHWRRIHYSVCLRRSTNLLERVNKEVKRRTKVIGVFPDRPSVIRLVGSILNEIDDDWRASQRRYFSQKSMSLITDPEMADDDQSSMFLVELTTNINSEAQTNLHH
ncbi:MAG: IS256 family transposase [Anaerolineales bacterium]|jgi:transposase-like protein